MTIGISAVHMDITRNIINYPTTAIAYFGTSTGELYKSTDSMETWRLIGTFTGIVEIMSSNTDPDKVVVGASDGVWISKDGGISWDLSLETP